MRSTDPPRPAGGGGGAGGDTPRDKTGGSPVGGPGTVVSSYKKK